MTAREKADWLTRVNPYKQKYLSDSFREGARAFWTGRNTADATYRINSRERHAFWKGYEAAQDQEANA